MRTTKLAILTIVFLLLTNVIVAQEADSEEIILNMPTMSKVFVIGPGPSLSMPSEHDDNDNEGDHKREKSKNNNGNNSSYKNNHEKNATGHASGVDPNRSYLNYLSIVGESYKNKISAVIANPNLPERIFLYVQVAKGTAEKGIPGVPVTNSWIPLSNIPRDVVRKIGTCYTGDGPETGHRLKYRWDVKKSEYRQIMEAIGTDIVINYTISADI